MVVNLKNLFQLEYHWVVLESKIHSIEEKEDNEEVSLKYNFNVYSWGSKYKYLKESITWEHFAHNYYGFIKAK